MVLKSTQLTISLKLIADNNFKYAVLQNADRPKQTDVFHISTEEDRNTSFFVLGLTSLSTHFRSYQDGSCRTARTVV